MLLRYLKVIFIIVVAELRLKKSDADGPYLTTSVMVIVIKLLTQGSMSVDNPVTIFSFVEMFYMPVAGYFLWFIWALWWMFVLVPLFRGKQKHVELFCLRHLSYISFRLDCLESFVLNSSQVC